VDRVLPANGRSGPGRNCQSGSITPTPRDTNVRSPTSSDVSTLRIRAAQ